MLPGELAGEEEEEDGCCGGNEALFLFGSSCLGTSTGASTGLFSRNTLGEIDRVGCSMNPVGGEGFAAVRFMSVVVGCGGDIFFAT